MDRRITEALRWLGGRGPMIKLTARVLCAHLVRESVSFFLREIVRPSGIHCYHLRESGQLVAVRHTAGDAATLAEVYHRHDYLPTPRVAAAIGTPKTILDLGANVGYFGIYAAARWPESEIVGYEADPGNVPAHEETIAANGLGARWRVVCAAAGASEGEVDLAAGRAMGSFVVATGTDPGVPTIRVPMHDVLAEVSGSDLVKLDIEGGEWAIVGDPRFAANPPRALVLEYHPHLCPTNDPRGAAEQALDQAGLTTEPIWHREDGYGMLWAWRSPDGAATPDACVGSESVAQPMRT